MFLEKRTKSSNRSYFNKVKKSYLVTAMIYKISFNLLPLATVTCTSTYYAHPISSPGFSQEDWRSILNRPRSLLLCRPHVSFSRFRTNQPASLFVYLSFTCAKNLLINSSKLASSFCSWFEPPRDKTNKMACAHNEDSNQPWHPPSLIRVFAVRRKKVWVLSYPLSAQRRLWSDWADAQADLSLRWAHCHFVGNVMRRLIFKGVGDRHQTGLH